MNPANRAAWSPTATSPHQGWSCRCSNTCPGSPSWCCALLSGRGTCYIWDQSCCCSVSYLWGSKLWLWATSTRAVLLLFCDCRLGPKLRLWPAITGLCCCCSLSHPWVLSHGTDLPSLGLHCGSSVPHPLGPESWLRSDVKWGWAADALYHTPWSQIRTFSQCPQDTLFLHPVP